MATIQLPELLKKNEDSLLRLWLEKQSSAFGNRISNSELSNQCREFLSLFIQALQSGDLENTTAPAWRPVRDLLASVSRSRGLQGFSPSETATFIFSLKQPLFELLRKTYAGDGGQLGEEFWRLNQCLDSLGLFVTEVYQKAREEVIIRQQEELLELSTPVVKLWDGVLALPMIGTLDSSRTQVVMESLLQKIVDTNSEVAIIDITGVPTVDTLVAQHLIKTVTAARLMGADCIISGIRPQIAATIVHLGVDLGNIVTKATLADAFALALTRLGRAVVKVGIGQKSFNSTSSRDKSSPASEGWNRDVRG